MRQRCEDVERDAGRGRRADHWQARRARQVREIWLWMGVFLFYGCLQLHITVYVCA